ETFVFFRCNLHIVFPRLSQTIMEEVKFPYGASIVRASPRPPPCPPGAKMGIVRQFISDLRP
ncbi:MAG: hypothetical protein WKG03_06210, partial [Telluria sp.]